MSDKIQGVSMQQQWNMANEIIIDGKVIKSRRHSLDQAQGRYDDKMNPVTIDKEKKIDPISIEEKIALREKQIEMAMQGNATMLIWLGKQYLGQLDKQEVEHIRPIDEINFEGI